MQKGKQFGFLACQPIVPKKLECFLYMNYINYSSNLSKVFLSPTSGIRAHGSVQQRWQGSGYHGHFCGWSEDEVCVLQSSFADGAGTGLFCNWSRVGVLHKASS